MTREPTILALGGGGFTTPPGDPELDSLLLDLCAVKDPRVLFLPTASGDTREQIAAFDQTYADRCRATHLSLFRLHGMLRPLRDIVLSQDAVYVGGGSMRNMLAIWRAHGLDQILHEAWERGVVLIGLSAGAMCWFQGGVTMSGGAAEPIEGLGFLPGSLSVHADGEPARLPVWLDAVRTGALPGGWAADDGAGLVLRGERVERIVSARPGAGLLRVDAVGGELVRRREPVELLGAGTTTPVDRAMPDDIREFRALRQREIDGGRRRRGS